MSSYKLCERLIALRGVERYDVVVLGEEPRPAYDRVHLTDFLGGRSADQLTLGSREWYASNGIVLHTGRRVVSLDRGTRTVTTATGDEFVYDKLVFATGSRPFVPAMEGVDLPGVFVYRTVEDLAAIREWAAKSRSAAVIGGGLLGLEAARALATLGIDCHIVEYAAHVLCAQLDPRAGEIARRKIEAMGMHVHVNVRVARIRAEGSQRVLEFVDKDQSSIAVDCVVIATGIRPRHELAEACGLRIAMPGGILINDRLETSDPNVYAIGECASHKGVTYGLVAPAYRMAEVLVANLLGETQLFQGADLSTRLKVLGVDVAVLGDYNQPAESFCWESEGSYRRVVVRDGRLAGASALGAWPQAGEMQDAVLKGKRVWQWQIRRFHRSGVLWPSRRRDVNEWPLEATVCNCMNVSHGTLKRACATGCETVQGLADATGASTLCGSCKPLLAALVGKPLSAQQPAKGARGLGVAATAAFLFALAFCLAPSLPFSSSVQTFPYDAVWRSGAWKQATGFTLAGLICLGLITSARKRLKKFTVGDFGFWRAAHALLGTAGLIALVAHTGMRFGANLDAALMTVFVFANLLGAVAGGLVSMDHRFAGGRTIALRKGLFWLHVALVWPVPVLLGFHILAAYYF